MEGKTTLKTLILAMGNPILRDDGVGHRVADVLEQVLGGTGVALKKTTLAGLNLLDLLIGFDRAVIVDAIQTGRRPGDVYSLTPSDFISRHTFPHLHNIDFFRALYLGKKLLPNFPEEVRVVAVEAGDITNFGEGLTPDVEKAVPVAVRCVLSILEDERKNPDSKEPALCSREERHPSASV